VLCREEGLDLSRFFAASENSELNESFGLMGVVKEVGVDDEGLAELYVDYFTHPLYHDEGRILYDALGGRALKLTTWNPFRWIRFILGMKGRHKAKAAGNGGKMVGNLIGEGMVQGGVVIFDQFGQAQYAYREETGDELPLEDIMAAAMAVKTAQFAGASSGEDADATTTTTTATDSEL
jgi:hypothetical protein